MMGTKLRRFAPVTYLALDDLVAPDHFYRHLERVLDLAFVRELVRDCYKAAGQPSVDPVVFFKLQLIMFFEGVRSERQLLRIAAYLATSRRLVYEVLRRWYDEGLPGLEDLSRAPLCWPFTPSVANF